MDAMDKMSQDFINQYGPKPTTMLERLAHVVEVLDDVPDDKVMVQTSDGVYGPDIKSGLTMGDLRKIYDLLKDRM